MNSLHLESAIEAVELLVEDLATRTAAAAHRAQLQAEPNAVQLQQVRAIEAAAHDLLAVLRAGLSHARGELVRLVRAAAVFDAQHPYGGELLEAEHAQPFQMMRTVAAHLVGEFSFAWLADDESRAFLDEALAVLNEVAPAHSALWNRTN